MKKFSIAMLCFLISFAKTLNAFEKNEAIINVICSKTNNCIAELNNKQYKINIGLNGLTNNKNEGDKKTPIGEFKLSNKIYYRADKINFNKKNKHLKFIPIKENSCWCDDPKSKKYNQFININKNESCDSFENLYRNDNQYDIVIPIEYNMNPVIPGKGSAIFIHVQRDINKPTAGCISLDKNDLMRIIESLRKKNSISIIQK